MTFTPFFLIRYHFANFAGVPRILIGNLILIALGACLRLIITKRRDFRVAAVVLAAGWAVLEVIADIAAGTELGLTLTGLAFRGGRLFLMAGLGFFLCHLLCTLTGRRPAD